MYKIIRIYVIGITSFLVLYGCKGNKNNSRDTKSLTGLVRFEDATTFHSDWSRNNNLVFHTIAEPENLHPTNGNSSARNEIISYLHAYLLKIDPATQSLSPSLVEDLPEVSADGLEYTYSLRKDIFWDNGDPVLAGDMLFTAKANKCPLTKNPAIKGYWNALKDIRLYPEQPQKFTMLMKEKNTQNAAIFTSFPLLQKKFYDSGSLLNDFTLPQLDDTAAAIESDPALIQWAAMFNDDKFGRQPEFISGLGPYKVQNWEPGQFITLVRKERINKGQIAYPEKLIFKLNKDENSTQLEFKSQLLDASVNISTSSYFSLVADSMFTNNYNHALTLTYNYTYLAFNTRPESTERTKAFTDPATRKALAYLTPVDLIIKLVYKDYSDRCKRMTTAVSPLKAEYNADLPAIPFDIAEGKRLLQAAGWADRDGDGILEKQIDGKTVPLETELLHLSTSSDWKDMAALIAEQFEKAGIKVNLVPADVKSFIEKARAHDFDLILGSWSTSPLYEDYTQLWHTSSWENHGTNYPGFGNAESDALIDSIRVELNEEQRLRQVRRLQEMINNDQPMVFLYTNLRRNLVHKRFGSATLYPDKPGLLLNELRLLSTSSSVTSKEDVNP